MAESKNGWKEFREGYPWFSEKKKYPLQAYSEFMPPQRIGINPSDGSLYPWLFSEDDIFGMPVQEIEEEYQLRPGLMKIGHQLMEHILQLGAGKLPVSLAGHNQRNLADNIFWPAELLEHKSRLEHERYVIMSPLSLSRTKDDKGRICWTFFGASEQGPEKAFWKSFYEAPGKELPESVFITFLAWILKKAYSINLKDREHLLSLGFRILPSEKNFPFSYWHTESIPSWTKQYQVNDSDDFKATTFLLTFRPFSNLPPPVKEKYLAGKLNLIPFPGSLMMWGIKPYLHLQETLYNAIQIPMLRLVKREDGFSGLRVPQSGWLVQPELSGKKAKILEEFIENNYIRTNRWDKFHRNENGLLKSKKIDPVVQTLISTDLAALDLYNKPMARNCQLFNEHFELVLDGPHADRRQIGLATLKLLEGGAFRYRFYFPPMLAGEHEVFHHRPVVGCLSAETGEPVVTPDLLSGYFTGYHREDPDLSDPVELWPRFRRREPLLVALENFNPEHDKYLHQTSMNVLALIDTWDLMGRGRMKRDIARSLVRIPKEETLEGWLTSLPGRSVDPVRAKIVVNAIDKILEPAGEAAPSADHLTFQETASRKYEVAYWNEIYFLSHGSYTYKDNADIVQDSSTLNRVQHLKRDLHKLGDYLLKRYQKEILSAGMENSAEAGELPFKWETDFEYPGYGGWVANQKGSEYERNILVIIPGKNRKEAIVMADHYDTAYMADVFDPELGGMGGRFAAAGADDNHSATAAMLMAAPVYLKMAKEGKLERDIWLLHLTGEEFPSDCMGARNFCQNIVQRSLKMKKNDGKFKDLSLVTVKGVLVMDMIAHNRDNFQNVFQIAPGKTEESLRLAAAAHQSCQAWNRNVQAWNETPDRKGCRPGRRTNDIRIIPPKALHLKVDGEIRTWEDPHSTLYNTDGIIFADTGIPVILFMENYDIHRTGYHDTHDTMENIDLDYGAAVSAIAIETVARLASG
ncbi:MAG: M28 family peptidase [Bacteroidetes bacterium]|nr:M28 family peptidase [Bacteroidota bacterium]